MKRLFFIFVAGIIGFYGLSFAWNEFSYENAKSLANEYIENSSFDENWKDTHPRVEGEGKYFYTDAETPSYVEFKVSCDTTKNCGFIMVNFDGDDVSIPIASTSGNTPSEVLAAKNGNDEKNNKLYYFNPFEQYAENEVTGDVSSIDPQDDFGDEVSGTEKLTPEIKKEKKSKKNKSLKDKIVKAKSDAKEFKKSDDFKKKKKELKDKKQTIPKEEVSFKYLDMALADEGENSNGAGGYLAPAIANIFVTGSSTPTCNSRTPCYNQYKTLSGSYYYFSGCTPTAVAIIYGYYDRTFANNSINYNNLISGLASDVFGTSSPNTNIKSMIDELRVYMGTYYTYDSVKKYYGGATNINNHTKGIKYAINKGYTKSTSSLYTGNVTTLFNKLKSEINSSRPVMVSTAMHSMVAYGYNSTSGLPIIRVNMGWGNEYYMIGTPFEYSHIDYNMNAIYYGSPTVVNKGGISSIVTFYISK